MQEKKIDSTFLITILIIYFGACGGLWHIGYWSTFEINYLQYIGLTDIIKDFAVPFLTSSGVSIAGFVLSSISNYHDRIDNPNSLLFGKGRETNIGKKLNKWYLILVSIYFSGLLAIILFGNDYKWIALPFLISIPISIFLTNKGLFLKLIINPDIRASVIHFLIILPVISFCFSKKQSIEIYKNYKYKYINEIKISKNLDEVSRFNGLKYLGSSTDKIFLANFNNSEITILNSDEITYVTYKDYKP